MNTHSHRLGAAIFTRERRAVCDDLEKRIGGPVNLETTGEAFSRIFFHRGAIIRSGPNPAVDQARCARKIIIFHVSRLVESDFTPNIDLV